MTECSSNLDMSNLHISDNAFVLHRFPYRETSFIVELLTQHHGRVSVVAKGVRSPKSLLKGVLQPFVPLRIEARGKSQLKLLTLAEACGAPLRLVGNGLMSGLYVNELLMRLLHKEEACHHLFLIYHATLLSLEVGQGIEKALRLFEKDLLIALGYELSLTREAYSHEEVAIKKYYRFIAEHGLQVCLDEVPKEQSQLNKTNIFLGRHLLAIAKDQLHDRETLLAAKRLLRLALAPLLGNKPLKSRELFKATVGKH